MSDLRIKEYLAQAGIRRVHELDTALLEAFGQEEGQKHIKKLTELYDRSEERLFYGSKDTAYLRRQEELVDYLNQSLMGEFTPKFAATASELTAYGDNYGLFV